MVSRQGFVQSAGAPLDDEQRKGAPPEGGAPIRYGFRRSA